MVDHNDPGHWLDLGNTQFRKKRFREALQAFDRGLELAPKYAILWLGRGDALCRLNRFVEALQAYDRGLELAPNDAQLLLGRENALLRLNRFGSGTSEAVDAQSLVLLLDPGTATAEEIAKLLFEFSTLYRMLGGSGITFTKTDAREPAFA